MILVDEKYVLTIFFKIPISSTLGLFDFSLSHSKIHSFITAIEENTYIILQMGSDIFRVERQSEIESKKNEQLLFRIKREENFNYILENPSVLNFSEYNSESLNNKLWLTINSTNSKYQNNYFIGDSYIIYENDVLKFGNIKYIVKQISLNKENIKTSEKKNAKEINFEFYPNIQTHYFTESKDSKGQKVVCEICKSSICGKENPIVQFCPCNCLHFECLKKKIKLNTYFREKNKVKNYYFNKLKCQTCDYIFPIRFRLSEIKYELVDIEIPDKNTNYMIIESIEKKIYYGYMKLIHIIKFEEEKQIINIGRNKKENEIIIPDPSVSKKHAQFIFEKNEGKILLKNLNKKFGSSVFFKNAINVDNNPIQIQTGKITFLAQKMKFKDFKKKSKKEKSKYPLPSKY